MAFNSVATLALLFFHLSGAAELQDIAKMQKWNCVWVIKHNGTLKLDCQINSYLQWTMSDFKNWSSRQPFKEILLNIVCSGDGVISLKRPIVADKLTSLIIRDCHNIEDNDDFEFSTINFTIQLRILQQFNVSYIYRSERLNKQILEWKKIISLMGCYGSVPTTLQVFTGSSMKYRIDAVKNENASMTDAAFKLLRKKSLELRQYRKKYPCIFSNLQKYEVMNSKNPGMFWSLSYFFEYGRFEKLQSVNISFMGFKDIPYDLRKWNWWRKYPALNTIDLSGNTLENVPYDNVAKDRNVTIIMKRNTMTKITKTTLEKLRKFYPSFIDLSDSRINCECSGEMLYLTSFLQDFSAKWQHPYRYLVNETCKSPVKLRGVRLENFDYMEHCGDAAIWPQRQHNDMNTEQNAWTQQVIITIFTVVTLLACVILVVKFRKEVKVLLYTRLKMRLNTDPQTSSMMKEYDVFVSYSSMNEEWVVSCLCPRLEAAPSCFRLCLHYKHFTPGASISHNIIESIEKSRHTIIVLSRHFLESEWCMLEFRKAFYQGLMEQKRHLIVILLEDIDTKNLDSDMKHVLKTQSYLKRNEYFFWDKLIYALSDEQTTRSRSKSESTTSEISHNSKNYPLIKTKCHV